LTPSLSYSEDFGISQVLIRSVSNSLFTGGDPEVALSADGVDLSEQETGVVFLDVQRIEGCVGRRARLKGATRRRRRETASGLMVSG
jgi:hypothetical protein